MSIKKEKEILKASISALNRSKTKTWNTGGVDQWRAYALKMKAAIEMFTEVTAPIVKEKPAPKGGGPCVG